MNSSVIQPSSRSGLPQARITSVNAVSIRISNRFALWRIDFVTRRPSSGTMPRGFGDHHPRRPPSADTSIGKIARRYALMSVAGSRSPPTAIRSASGHFSGGGNDHRLSPTGWGVLDHSVTAGGGAARGAAEGGAPPADQRGGRQGGDVEAGQDVGPRAK